MIELDSGPPLRRWHIPPWLPIASLFGLWIAFTAFELGGDTWLPALTLSGCIGAYAIVSSWLAGDRKSRSAAATCALLGAVWAYAVGFAAYWSSWEWFVKVDLLVIWLACLVAQTTIGRLRFGLRLGAHAVLLPGVTWMCYAYGALTRGFSEDPRM